MSEKMPVGMDSSMTKIMDDKKKKEFTSALKYGSGFGVRCDISARSQKIYQSTCGMDPHERLGRLTNFVLESLEDKEGMSDEMKSRILGSLIDEYRAALQLDD